jgi:DNA-binding response OmpR family regulator
LEGVAVRANLTPTERRFNDLLDDWHGHTPAELHALLWDEQSVQNSSGNGSAVQAHISNLRKKLPAGQEIMLRVVAGKRYYQKVRLVADPCDGRS